MQSVAVDGSNILPFTTLKQKHQSKELPSAKPEYGVWMVDWFDRTTKAWKIWSNTLLSIRLPLNDLATETKQLQGESLTIMAHLLHIIGVTT